MIPLISNQQSKVEIYLLIMNWPIHICPFSYSFDSAEKPGVFFVCWRHINLKHCLPAIWIEMLSYPSPQLLTLRSSLFTISTPEVLKNNVELIAIIPLWKSPRVFNFASLRNFWNIFFSSVSLSMLSTLAYTIPSILSSITDMCFYIHWISVSVVQSWFHATPHPFVILAKIFSNK